MQDKVWSNNTIAFNANYEIVNNVFALLTVESSNIKGTNATGAKIPAEYRTDAQGYLDMYTPQFLQGKNLTFTFGLKVGL